MYIPSLIVVSVFALCLLILVTLVFLIAQFKEDNSIMDIVYGPLFLFSGGLATWLLSSYSLLTLTILGATALWSTRLSWRIYRKNKGHPEDARYAKWREEWSKQGKIYFIIRSYLQINLLQGLVITIVSTPLLISLMNSGANFESEPLLSFSLPLGFLIYILGLSIESVADYQLDRFIAGKKAGTEPATLMTKGLFRYSRRPNYFGETLVWWGLAIMVLPLPFGYLALLSPLAITYTVTKITGPMLEKIFLERYPAEYKEYMRQTSYFLPLPPKA